MIHLFCGYDPREAVGFHVFAHSVISRASKPVSITPLAQMGLDSGSNAFTVSRFLVPFLMGFKGQAIFCDAADMIMLGDVAELDSMFSARYALQVVKRPDYKTRHPIKYRGTLMECPNPNYPKKNQASVMLINCEHPSWQFSRPEALSQLHSKDLLQFKPFLPSEVGELPEKWNVLVDEGDQVSDAKILHWTAGIPAFPMYRNAPCAEVWFREMDAMTEAMEIPRG